MVYSVYPKKMKWEHKVLCFLLAVAAVVQMFFAVPAEQIVAEVRNSDSRGAIRQEIWITQTRG